MPQCFHLSFRVNVCDKLNSEIFQPRFYLHIEIRSDTNKVEGDHDEGYVHKGVVHTLPPYRNVYIYQLDCMQVCLPGRGRGVRQGGYPGQSWALPPPWTGWGSQPRQWAGRATLRGCLGPGSGRSATLQSIHNSLNIAVFTNYYNTPIVFMISRLFVEECLESLN